MDRIWVRVRVRVRVRFGVILELSICSKLKTSFNFCTTLTIAFMKDSSSSPRRDLGHFVSSKGFRTSFTRFRLFSGFLSGNTRAYFFGFLSKL